MILVSEKMEKYDFLRDFRTELAWKMLYTDVGVHEQVLLIGTNNHKSL